MIVLQLSTAQQALACRLALLCVAVVTTLTILRTFGHEGLAYWETGVIAGRCTAQSRIDGKNGPVVVTYTVRRPGASLGWLEQLQGAGAVQGASGSNGITGVGLMDVDRSCGALDASTSCRSTLGAMFDCSVEASPISIAVGATLSEQFGSREITTEEWAAAPRVSLQAFVNQQRAATALFGMEHVLHCVVVVVCCYVIGAVVERDLKWMRGALREINGGRRKISAGVVQPIDAERPVDFELVDPLQDGDGRLAAWTQDLPPPFCRREFQSLLAADADCNANGYKIPRSTAAGAGAALFTRRDAASSARESFIYLANGERRAVSSQDSDSEGATSEERLLWACESRVNSITAMFGAVAFAAGGLSSLWFLMAEATATAMCRAVLAAFFGLLLHSFVKCLQRELWLLHGAAYGTRVLYALTTHRVVVLAWSPAPLAICARLSAVVFGERGCGYFGMIEVPYGEAAEPWLARRVVEAQLLPPQCLSCGETREGCRCQQTEALRETAPEVARSVGELGRGAWTAHPAVGRAVGSVGPVEWDSRSGTVRFCVVAPAAVTLCEKWRRRRTRRPARKAALGLVGVHDAPGAAAALLERMDVARGVASDRDS